MRQIEVSTDVFARIWSKRQEGEESENQILDRILRGPPAPIGTRVSPSKGRAESDVVKSGITSTPLEARKVRWVDDVHLALEDLGGKARLFEIYKKVEKIRQAAGRTIPKTLEATIRRTLEDHCSDSSNFRGIDLFAMPEGHGAGLWALRK